MMQFGRIALLVAGLADKRRPTALPLAGPSSPAEAEDRRCAHGVNGAAEEPLEAVVAM